MQLLDMMARVGTALRGRSAHLRAELPPVTLIGHPYRPTGRGQHIRAIWAAMGTAGIRASLYDIRKKKIPTDPAFRTFAADVVAEIPTGIRLFHINGLEAGGVLQQLEARQPGFLSRGYNVVYPAWELPRFRAEWARVLERFDETWAASAFVFDAIRAATTMPILQIPNACEPHLEKVFSRAHFGLAADRFLILYFFDVASFVSRKNPEAAIAAFRAVLTAQPFVKAQLVLKLNNSEHDPRVAKRLGQLVGDLGDRVAILQGSWPLDEARSLIGCSDCFLSLHRSEGFGRGPAEAMFLGKPVVATGWSGNMTFMRPGVSWPVGYKLIPVAPEDYPAWEGQVWAEPDVGEAASALVRLIEDPVFAGRMGRRAQAHMRKHFSDAALGVRYRARLAAIVGEHPTRFGAGSLTPSATDQH